MDVKHSKNGLHFPFDGRYLTIMSGAVLKKMTRDSDIVTLAKALIKYNQDLGRLSHKEIRADEFEIGASLSKDDIATESTLTKYISPHEYDNYYSKGLFQLGNSEYYRTIENENSKDGFEGFNCTFLDVNCHHIPVIFFQTNNHLMFCGSSQENSQYLTGQFGQIKMKIRNVVGFCETIQRHIGAKNHLIGKILYSNARIYKSKPLAVPDFFPNEVFINRYIMQFLISNALLPSLFVKPLRFSNEQEMRLTFEMKQDHVGPYRFECKELLKFIEFAHPS